MGQCSRSAESECISVATEGERPCFRIGRPKAGVGWLPGTRDGQAVPDPPVLDSVGTAEGECSRIWALFPPAQPIDLGEGVPACLMASHGRRLQLDQACCRSQTIGDQDCR
jgi:hypothetical protein